MVCKSAYWLIEMDPVDHGKDRIHSSNWSMTIYSYAICLGNAPATFEKLMENGLRGVCWKTCFLHLDDVIEMDKLFEKNFKNLKKVFQRLRDVNLVLSPKKCYL